VLPLFLLKEGGLLFHVHVDSAVEQQGMREKKRQREGEGRGGEPKDLYILLAIVAEENGMRPDNNINHFFQLPLSQLITLELRMR
jgi:hypothetical protein